MHKDFEEYTRKRTSKIESSHKHIHQINNYSLPRNLQQIAHKLATNSESVYFVWLRKYSV